MHSTFIFDPHAIFERYSKLFTPTSRLREGARVGFFVPARLSYLLFGALAGFYMLRYAFVLIAIVPLYMLLRRLYGRWAGFVGVALVMSSPVPITAWGTDYSDSAAVSYLTGALASLGLALLPDTRQRAWMLIAATLLTMTVWAHGVSVPLAGVTVLAYAGVTAWRDRGRALGDLTLMLGCFLIVTLLLAVGSKLLLGQFNFIAPTLNSASYLSQAAQEVMWHSVSNAWAKYDNYLLVPPVVVLVFFATFARRLRLAPPVLLFVGVTGALEVLVFFYLQFFGSLQTLEQHYFSSTLWSSVSVMLALAVCEMARPIVEPAKGLAREPKLIAAAIPALIVVLVALVWEWTGFAPHMTWTWRGLALGAAVLAVALAVALAGAWVQGAGPRFAAPASGVLALVSGAGITLVLAGLLVLTVAQPAPHPPLAHTVFDPYPAYSTALGGDDGEWVDNYAVTAQVPAFVGGPSYPAEVLLQWEPPAQMGALQGPMGIYHNAFTWVSPSFPVPGKHGIYKINVLKAAQVVMMSLTGQDFARAVASLAQFDPVVVKRGILSHGAEHLHIWLVDLRKYLVGPPSA